MIGMGDDPPLEGFLNTLRRSRLFDAGDLDRFTGRLRPASARAFADALIRSGDLTHYQADKLLRGRWQGLVLGPYSVLAPLGRGGMGTVVYLARDRRLTESLGDSVLLALKLLPDRKAVEDPKVLAASAARWNSGAASITQTWCERSRLATSTMSTTSRWSMCPVRRCGRW